MAAPGNRGLATEKTRASAQMCPWGRWDPSWVWLLPTSSWGPGSKAQVQAWPLPMGAIQPAPTQVHPPGALQDSATWLPGGPQAPQEGGEEGPTAPCPTKYRQLGQRPSGCSHGVLRPSAGPWRPPSGTAGAEQRWTGTAACAQPLTSCLQASVSSPIKWGEVSPSRRRQWCRKDQRGRAHRAPSFPQTQPGCPRPPAPGLPRVFPTREGAA